MNKNEAIKFINGNYTEIQGVIKDSSYNYPMELLEELLSEVYYTLENEIFEGYSGGELENSSMLLEDFLAHLKYFDGLAMKLVRK